MLNSGMEIGWIQLFLQSIVL